ncbi:MAG: RNA polymerase sigma factor [Candidatus Eremiobacteraeota bacterium]|nr:RNA polymerase sigma factor [Candidatus Eremiobacteraeota bacterium]
MAVSVPAEVIEAARDGSEADTERLLVLIWPEAYRLARSIVGERQGAEDVAQEACIILCRTLKSLHSSAAFRVWFYRVVVREASEFKRRRSREEPPTATAPDTADHVAALDVWHALSVLPRKLRDVVVLRYFEDLSSREIASVLRIPDGTVRFRLMIAKRLLRPLLDERPGYISPTLSEVTTHAV